MRLCVGKASIAAVLRFGALAIGISGRTRRGTAGLGSHGLELLGHGADVEVLAPEDRSTAAGVARVVVDATTAKSLLTCQRLLAQPLRPLPTDESTHRQSPEEAISLAISVASSAAAPTA